MRSENQMKNGNEMKNDRKTHWLRNTVIVLLICCVAGTALAVVLYNRNPDRTYAIASIQFSYNGAGEGLTPNGYPLDLLSGLHDGEVLSAALEASGLTGTYTTEQLKDNLTVIGVYPESIVKQMTAYTSLLDANAQMQAVLKDYHPTQYSVTLYHDFDPKISPDQLKGLLDHILAAYREYFAKTGTIHLAELDEIESLEEYDFLHQLQAIGQSAEQQGRIAEEMAERAAAFRKEGRSFDDIRVSFENLEKDIDRLTASITLSGTSRNLSRLRQQYTREISTMERELAAAQEELSRIEELMASYEKDGIVYISTSSAVQKVSTNASDTYDDLAEKRQKMTNSIAALTSDMTRTRGLLEDLTATAGKANETATESVAASAETMPEESGAASASEENAPPAETTEMTTETGVENAAATETASAETSASADGAVQARIRALAEKKNRVTAEFSEMLDAYAAQEVNERTVAVSGLKYREPSLMSTAFLMKALKTAGPLCAAGLMVCLVLLIISRRREEKGQA